MATVKPLKYSEEYLHTPFQAGDMHPGETIPISLDAGNTLVLGADSGLYVPQVGVAGVVEGIMTGDSMSVELSLSIPQQAVPIADATLLGGVSLDIHGRFVVPTTGMYEISSIACFSFGAGGPDVLHRGVLGGYIKRENSAGDAEYLYMLFGIPVVYGAQGGFQGEFPSITQSGSVHVKLDAGDTIGAMLESTQIFGDIGLPVTGQVKQMYIRLIHS